MTWWAWLLIVTAGAATRFEDFGTLALVGVDRPTTIRLDDLIRRHPYFEDLVRVLQRAYEEVTLSDLKRATCTTTLDAASPESFVTVATRRRERVVDLLVLLSFMEADADPLARLAAHVGALAVEIRPETGEALRELRLRWVRDDEPRSPNEVLTAIGGVRSSIPARRFD